MIHIFGQTTNVQLEIEQTKSILQQIGESVFNWRSLLVLVICLAIAVVAGNIAAALARRLTRSIARSADESSNLGTVNRLRRLETVLIISIAVVRLFLIVVAIYSWWAITHPNSFKPNSILGAGALTAVIIGGAITPLLRDFSFGAGMMAERWFGVGDHISIDFPKVEGVVERITLRSTRLRGLNGEIIWVANQTINGVSVAQKGVRRTAIEIFARDPDSAENLVERVNNLLPGGMSMLVSPLEVVEVIQRDEDIWHITVIGETAPGRDWILERTALEVFKKIDSESEHPTLLVDPVARYADPDTERQLARAVRNARKKRQKPNYMIAVDSLKRSRTSDKSLPRSTKVELSPEKTDQR